jgi:hypothetical protein
MKYLSKFAHGGMEWFRVTPHKVGVMVCYEAVSYL